MARPLGRRDSGYWLRSSIEARHKAMLDYQLARPEERVLVKVLAQVGGFKYTSGVTSHVLGRCKCDYPAIREQVWSRGRKRGKPGVCDVSEVSRSNGSGVSS